MASMVRKGSPVRVRQRALTKPPLIGGFVFPRTGPVRTIAEHLRNTAPLATGRSRAPANAAFRGLGRFGAVQAAADALDLLLGADALRRVEVLPHARVVAQQRGRAVSELLGHVLRRLAL